MNKKAIAYEFLLRLIIAILFVSATLYIGKSLFRLTGSGFDSYLGFVSTINSLEDGQFKEVGVDFDKETAIIGFNSDAERFECYDCAAPSIDNRPRAIFEKPRNDECKDGACICLCSKVLSKTYIGTLAEEILETKQFACESLTCRKSTNSDIIDLYKPKNLFLKSLNTLWKGGFVYGRGIDVDLHGME